MSSMSGSHENIDSLQAMHRIVQECLSALHAHAAPVGVAACRLQLHLMLISACRMATTLQTMAFQITGLAASF
jgi:hypothetical protein